MVDTAVAAAARIAVVPDPAGSGGRVCALGEDGAAAGAVRVVQDLAAAMTEREAAGGPRWVWAGTDEAYPWLLDRGAARLARCHDVKLVESLLLGQESRHGRPRSLGAAWARLHGLREPEDSPDHGAEDQPVLFTADRRHLPQDVDPLTALVAVHAAQQQRIADGEHPDRMRLLCAAESAGALAAVEMGRDGLPWSARVHDELLTGLLGPRPAGGNRPALLGELTTRIQEALGRPVNPDSPLQVLPAFARVGVHLTSTRSHELSGVDHPAAALLQRYKELSRIHAAHGWAWRESWVRDGRFRAEYVVGGVVSGRWASRGGGALQIPRLLRAAVVADPGHRFVVADAGQLEPRVLAAMSGDAGLAAASADGDLYAALARDAFAGDRPRAKIAVLAAMYGQTSGEAGQLLAVMRRRFPDALALVEAAATTGEAGGIVRSQLGRTSPTPSAERFLDEDAGSGDGLPTDRRAARSWGRFTRNFIIQASATDWALAMLASLRRRLTALGPEPRLVFFQHDEVIVHTPTALAPEVERAVTAAGDEARRLVFGGTPVRFPLETHVVRCYAEAK